MVGGMARLKLEDVRPSRDSKSGFDVIVSSRNDASKCFILKRQIDDFERLHYKLGKPKKFNFPRKTSGNPSDLCAPLTSYLRAVLSEPDLTNSKEEVDQFLEAGLLNQFFTQLNEQEQFNNLNAQLKDDELHRTRNDLAEARARLYDARTQLQAALTGRIERPEPQATVAEGVDEDEQVVDSEGCTNGDGSSTSELDGGRPALGCALEQVVEELSAVGLERGELSAKVMLLLSELRASQVRVCDAEGRAAAAARQLLQTEKKLVLAIEAKELLQQRAEAAEEELAAQSLSAAEGERESRALLTKLQADFAEMQGRATVTTDQKIVEQAASAAIEATALLEHAERRAAEAEAKAAEAEAKAAAAEAKAELAMADVALLTQAAANAEARVAQAEARLEVRGEKACKAAAEAAQALARAEVRAKMMEDRAVASEIAVSAMREKLAEAIAMRDALDKQARPTIISLLPPPEEALRSLQVSVATASPSPGGWWLFHVAIACAGATYMVYRRYREFRNLHLELAGAEQLPRLPRKHSTRTQTDAFVEKRRQALDTYLVKLAASPCLFRPELHAFLEMSLLLAGDHKSGAARESVLHPQLMG